MEGFTLIDAVVAGVIVLSAILAYSRGFVREAMAIVGWIGAALVAFLFAAAVQPLVKELPVVGEFLGDSCELSIIAAFAVVFAGADRGLALHAAPLLGHPPHRLGGLDQGLGFLFGVVRGVLLVAVAFIVYDRAVAANAIPMVDDSRSAKVFAQFQDNLDAQANAD
jgi:membrane protein required for colicin V production